MKSHRFGKGGIKVRNKQAAGILFTDGNSILLLKRSNESDNAETWCLPGGGAKEGETKIGTAIRETKEETGLDNIPGRRFETLVSKDGRKTFTTFLYSVQKQFDIDQLSNEHSDWKWVSFDEMKSTELHPKFKDTLPRYLNVIRRKLSSSFTEWVRIRDVESKK